MQKDNPLTHKLSFQDDSGLEKTIELGYEKIKQYKGVIPTALSIAPVRTFMGSGGWHVSPYLIARWRGAQLTPEMVNNLEILAEDMHYPNEIITRTNQFGRNLRPVRYRDTNATYKKNVKGYLFSEAPWSHTGLYVMREFDSEEKANLSGKRERGKWLYGNNGLVELRLNLKTTNLITLEYLTRISSVLANNPITDTKGLIYDLYRSIMLLGIDKKTRDKLVGLDDIIDFMRWTMFSPQVSPAAEEYGLKSQSVMLAGVPGVGKTSIAKLLASEDSNTLFVPVEPLTLLKSLEETEEETDSLFDTIDNLQERTGVNMVIYCDDIENATMDIHEDKSSPYYGAGISQLLNRLQGVGSGKYMLSGSTNNPSLVDPRFLEFGRIGYVMHIPLPDRETRRKTFELYSKERKIESVDFSKLVDVTDGFSYRAIEEVSNRAGSFALQRAAKSIQKKRELLIDASRRVTPEIASEFPINSGDFHKGLEIVRRHLRVRKLKELDKRIKKFCEEYQPMGF